jgi:hypothetical protein
MKFIKYISILYILTVFGCEKEQNSTGSQSTKIYFRWTEDFNPAVCPTLRALNYKDNNDAVPDNAVNSNYYGNCTAGTYQGEYDFVDTTAPSNPTRFTFTYTLTNPAPGYARYYSKRLCGYDPPVNRCLSFAGENNLVFVDQKL